MKRTLSGAYIAMISALALVGCSTSKPVSDDKWQTVQSQTPTESSHVTPERDTPFRQPVPDPIDEYLAIYEQWKGVPYRLGGETSRGVDCSAFVQQLHSALSSPIDLPRTTALQVKEGIKIDFSERLPGDLVFFKTTRTVRHVGIVVDNDHFIHASSSKGVTKSRLDNPYWRPRLWQVRRLIAF